MKQAQLSPKFGAIIIGLAFMGSGIGVSLGRARAATVSDLEAQLRGLQLQLEALLAQVPQPVPSSSGVLQGFQFTRTLSLGLRDAATNGEVSKLQAFLKEAYSEQLVTGYFGTITAGLVSRFQRAHDLPPVGIFGPRTRALVNQLLAARRPMPAIANVSPARAAIGQAVTITGSGFTSERNTVLLGGGALMGLPSQSGVAITFTLPASIDPSCRFTTPPCGAPTQTIGIGSYSLAVQNVNGVSRYVSFEVADAPFALGTLSDITLPQPQTGTATASTTISLTISSTTTSSVQLSVRGLPRDTTFTPLITCTASCAFPATLTIRSTTPTGTSTVSVVGSAGGYTAVSSFALTVTPPVPLRFRIEPPGDMQAMRPRSGTLAAGATTTATLLEGTPETVSFSVTGLPSGVSASMPGVCTPTCTRTVTLFVSSSAAAGTSTVKILGVARSFTASTTLMLSIVPPPPFQFSIGAAPDLSLPLPTYGTLSATNTITTALTSGVWERITFSASGFPAGVSAPSVAVCDAPCTRTHTVTVGTNARPGSYPIILTGTNGRGVTQSATYTLTITDPVPFRYTLSNSGNITLAKPTFGSASAENSVTAASLEGTPHPVSFSESGFPAGASGTSLGACTPTCTRVNRVTISTATPVGSSLVTVTAVGGGITSTTNYTLTVTDPAPYEIELSASGNVTIARPASGTASASNVITATHLGGYAQPMAFSQSGFPAGAGAASPSSCTPTCSGTNTVTVGALTSTGTYPIRITASGGGITASTTYQLIVE